MKKLFTYSLFLTGFFGFSTLKAATYTHQLTYNHDDNSGNAVLEATITFDDSSSYADTDTTDSRGEDLQTGFTTSITYYYTPVPGGTTYTLNTGNLRYYTFIRSSGTVDFDGDPTLKSQLSNLQFSNANGTGSFALSINEGTAFSLQAQVPGEIENDFSLDTTTQFPAPLPILGVIPAFTSIRKLKKRYNSIVNK